MYELENIACGACESSYGILEKNDDVSRKAVRNLGIGISAAGVGLAVFSGYCFFRRISLTTGPENFIEPKMSDEEIRLSMHVEFCSLMAAIPMSLGGAALAVLYSGSDE